MCNHRLEEPQTGSAVCFLPCSYPRCDPRGNTPRRKSILDLRFLGTAGIGPRSSNPAPDGSFPTRDRLLRTSQGVRGCAPPAPPPPVPAANGCIGRVSTPSTCLGPGGTGFVRHRRPRKLRRQGLDWCEPQGFGIEGRVSSGVMGCGDSSIRLHGPMSRRQGPITRSVDWSLCLFLGPQDPGEKPSPSLPGVIQGHWHRVTRWLVFYGVPGVIEVKHTPGTG